LTVIDGTADVLHFHEGDFHPDAGFFMGLDATGNYAGLTDANKSYALSRVDLTPDERGYVSPEVLPIAPEKVTLNTVLNSDNPIHGKGLTHLLLGAGQKPVVVAAGDQDHVHMVENYTQGHEKVLTNKSADLLVDWALQDALGGALPPTAKIFDIAATTQPTQFFNAGHGGAGDNRNLIFAAVAEKPELGPTGGGAEADATKTGIAVLSVEDNFLSPRDVTATNNPGVAGGKAAHINLAQGAADSIVAVTGDAKFANAGDINLWYDDRYKQVFGTLAGLRPDNANQSVAYGLFRGAWDNGADTFSLKPMVDLAVGKVQTGSEDKVAQSVFGAQVDTAWAHAKTAKPVIDLYRPRIMHTSTDKNYLLVSGGV
ncbi:MAG: hypothetical protein EBZ77_17315, partial [Chitinophagia bacterium]|nr:hypothetical protein [Chitinophagia bacterium]